MTATEYQNRLVLIVTPPWAMVSDILTAIDPEEGQMNCTADGRANRSAVLSAGLLRTTRELVDLSLSTASITQD